MKKILILIFIVISGSLYAQTGLLPYDSIKMTNTPKYIWSIKSQNSVRFYTSLDSFVFAKQIKMQNDSLWGSKKIRTYVSTHGGGGGGASSAEIHDSVQTVRNLANTKQDKLVSGTNIKTINNIPVIGSGNIVITGGVDSTKMKSNYQSRLDTTKLHNQIITKLSTTGKAANTALFQGKDTTYFKSLISGGGVTPTSGLLYWNNSTLKYEPYNSFHTNGIYIYDATYPNSTAKIGIDYELYASKYTAGNNNYYSYLQPTGFLAGSPTTGYNWGMSSYGLTMQRTSDSHIFVQAIPTDPLPFLWSTPTTKSGTYFWRWDNNGKIIDIQPDMSINLPAGASFKVNGTAITGGGTTNGLKYAIRTLSGNTLLSDSLIIYNSQTVSAQRTLNLSSSGAVDQMGGKINFIADGVEGHTIDISNANAYNDGGTQYDNTLNKVNTLKYTYEGNGVFSYSWIVGKVDNNVYTTQDYVNLSNKYTFPVNYKLTFTRPNNEVRYQMTGNTYVLADTTGAISGTTNTACYLGATGYSIIHGSQYNSTGDTTFYERSIKTTTGKQYTFLYGAFNSGIYRKFKATFIDSSNIVGAPVQLLSGGSFAANAASSSQINTTWTSPSVKGRYFRLDSASTLNGTYNTISSTISKNATGYNVTGLPASHTVYFRLYNLGNGIDTLTSTYASANATTSAVGAPTFVSANTNVTGDTVHMIFSKAMQASPSSTGLSFSPSKTISSITRHSTNTSQYDIKVSSAFVAGNTITTSYTPGTITANDGGVLATFSSQSVTNNVPSAPTLSSAATSTDGLTVTLTFSKTMGASPSSTGFSFSPSKTISNITQSGSTLVLTVSVAFASSDNITVSYTPGTIVAADGGVLGSFSGQVVTNNVVASEAYLSFTLTNMTDVSHVLTTTAANGKGIATITLTSGHYIIYQPSISASNTSVLLYSGTEPTGITDVNANLAFTDYFGSIYVNKASYNLGIKTGVASGNWLKLEYNADGHIYLYKSTDGVTYTVQYDTGSHSGAMSIKVMSATSGISCGQNYKTL